MRDPKQDYCEWVRQRQEVIDRIWDKPDPFIRPFLALSLVGAALFVGGMCWLAAATR